jgi:hypothetical protein
MYSSFEVVLQTMKHTVVYPGSGSFLEVIPYVQWFDIEDEHVLLGVSRELEKSTW